MIFGTRQQSPQPCGGCQQAQAQAQAQPRFSFPIPGLSQPVGSGTVVKQVLQEVGVQPCGGCQGRAAAMNRLVGFRPVGWV